MNMILHKVATKLLNQYYIIWWIVYFTPTSKLHISIFDNGNFGSFVKKNRLFVKIKFLESYITEISILFFSKRA